ncbi:hypothetical protein [Streptomyces sp. NPDC056255]
MDFVGLDVHVGASGSVAVAEGDLYFANRALRRLSVLDIIWLG